jgi:hypothetical protein
MKCSIRTKATKAEIAGAQVANEGSTMSTVAFHNREGKLVDGLSERFDKLLAKATRKPRLGKRRS